jgi:hypothetical protein
MACRLRRSYLLRRPHRFEASDLGGLTDAPTCFFGFGGKVYILNGSEYKVWDGTSLSDVAGYVPVIATATPPGGEARPGAGQKLTGKKRQRFSPTEAQRHSSLPKRA